MTAGRHGVLVLHVELHDLLNHLKGLLSFEHGETTVWSLAHLVIGRTLTGHHRGGESGWGFYHGWLRSDKDRRPKLDSSTLGCLKVLEVDGEGYQCFTSCTCRWNIHILKEVGQAGSGEVESRSGHGVEREGNGQVACSIHLPLPRGQKGAEDGRGEHGGREVGLQERREEEADEFTRSQCTYFLFLMYPASLTPHTRGEYSFIPGVTTDSLGLLSEPSLLTSASASPTVLGLALQAEDSHVRNIRG